MRSGGEGNDRADHKARDRGSSPWPKSAIPGSARTALGLAEARPGSLPVPPAIPHREVDTAVSDDRPGNGTTSAPSARHEIGDVGGHAKVVMAERIENSALYFSSAVRKWFPPPAPAPPPRHNHDRPLAQLREVVREHDEHTVLALVEGDRPRLGVSTVCRTALSGPGTERFPGGCHVVDLRSQDRATAVSFLLRRLGLPDAEIPTELPAREQRLAHELGAHGALAVLVDNVFRYEDVLPFLSDAPGSVTMVATNAVEGRFHERASVRDHLFLAEEVPVWVSPMTTEERVGVLALHAGVEDLDQTQRAMARELVETLGHDLWDVRETGRRIRYLRARGQDGLRIEYEAVDGGRQRVGLDGYTPEQRVRIAELACHPDADFAEEAAVALWGCGAREARDLLADLVERGHLEEAEGRTGRRRLRFAGPRRAERIRLGQGPSVDTDAARLTLLRHYRDLTRAVHEALSPHRWLFDDSGRVTVALSPEQAREWGAAELDTVRAAVHDAVDHGHPLLAFALCESFWAYWFHRGSFSEVVDTHTRLLEAVDPDGPLGRARYARLLVQRSIAFRRDQEFARAEADAVSALELARSAKPRHDLILLTALEARGDSYREHTATGTEGEGDLRAAEEHFAKSLRVAERLEPGDVRAVANAMRKLAEVRARRGARTEARALMEGAEHLWRTKLPEDTHNLARALTARADLEAGFGDRDEALNLWAVALDLHERVGDGRRVADLHVKRADVLELRDRQACLEELWAALRRYEAAGADARVAAVRDMIDAL